MEMSTPNYGLLRELPISSQAPVSALEAANLEINRRKQAQEAQLNEANVAEKNVQTGSAEIEQGFLSDKLQTQQKKLNADLEKVKIDNRQLEQSRKIEELTLINKYASALVHAPEDQKASTYEAIKQELDGMGIHTTKWPKQYDQQAANMASTAYTTSGLQLQEYDAKTKREEAEFKSPKNQVELAREKGVVASDIKATEAVNLSAQQAIKTKEILHNFDEATKQMALGTGPLIGKFQAIAGFSEAMKAQKYQEALGLGVLSSVHFGRVTNMEMNIVRAANPSISTSPKARKDIITSMNAILDREIEYQKFWQVMESKGVYDPTIKERLWNQFTEQNPVITKGEDGMPVTNLKNLSAWKKYTSNEAIEDMRTGQDFEPSGTSSPANNSQYSFNDKRDQVTTASGKTYSKEQLQKLAAQAK